jgi:hypothetical protein
MGKRKSDLCWIIEARLRKGKRWRLFDNWMETGRVAEEAMRKRMRDHPKLQFRLRAEQLGK